MKHHLTARAAACMLTLGLAAGLAPVAAKAQTANERWQWEAAIYGWFPAIGGSTSFPSSCRTSNGTPAWTGNCWSQDA